MRGPRNSEFQPTRAIVLNYIPFELGFAMTLHKAQGRTLPAVILALSHRPMPSAQMTFEGIFVALSRVKSADDIRILLSNPNDYTSLRYITQLNASTHIQEFFAGFSENHNKWDRIKAYEARLSNVLYGSSV